MCLYELAISQVYCVLVLFFPCGLVFFVVKEVYRPQGARYTKKEIGVRTSDVREGAGVRGRKLRRAGC